MNRHSPRACHHGAGFSIIELLVSIVIAGIAFGALVPVFVQAAKTGSNDKARAVALNMAQQAVEGCRRQTFEQVVSSTWMQDEETATGVKLFTVARTVVDQAASPSDARIVSKLLTVTVSWATPSPGGSAVLKTILYRQFAGPQIVDFTVAPWDAVNEWITDATVQLTATINAADVASMAPVTIGGATLTGYVELMITSVSGVVIPTMRVPYNAGAPSVYAATWLVPGGPGISDGYWTFKAVAFSAQKYPGNSWELAKRVESGPPAAVTNLLATAGEDWVSLTWSPSISNDLDSYEVYRSGPDGVAVLVKGGPAASPKFVATGFTDSGLARDVDYTYSVYAIDQVARKSAAATVTARTSTPASVQPAPATELQGAYSAAAAVLTWKASPSAGVAGYRVFKDGATDTWVATVSGPYCDLAQGYDSSASYQVKPYAAGSVLSLTGFAAIFPGPPVQAVANYGGTPWVKVDIPEEVHFELEVMNNVKSGKEALISLKYLGPDGKSVAAVVNPSQRVSYSTTEYEAEWEDLAAGVYQFSWEANGIKSGSRLVTLTAPKEKYQEKCIP